MSLDESPMPQKWVFCLGKAVIFRKRRSRKRENHQKTTFEKRGYLSCNSQDFIEKRVATGQTRDATGDQKLVFCLDERRVFEGCGRPRIAHRESHDEEGGHVRCEIKPSEL